MEPATDWRLLMKGKHSLRVRVTLGMLALVSLASGVFAVMVYLASEELEHNVLDHILERELSTFTERYRQSPDGSPVESAVLRIYLGNRSGDVPAELALWSRAPTKMWRSASKSTTY